MKPELRKAAELALKSEHWEWMEGMKDDQGRRLVEHESRLYWVEPGTFYMHKAAMQLFERRTMDVSECPRFSYRGSLPDMEDPATMGCVLVLLKRATGDDELPVMLAIIDRLAGDAL